MDSSNFKTEITKFHYNKPSNIAWYLKYVFRFGAIFYDLVTVVRNFLYDRFILPIECVNAKVISVGNITTGGVGKTPVVAEIATFYANQYNERVCIISRGYGGHFDNKEVNVIKADGEIKTTAYYAGDEPFWLAQNTSDEVIVLTCASRVKAANYAVNNFQVTKIILDDGFQHRKLNRDTDVVLIDSEKKFGNEAVLPYGPLRENLSGLNRADIIYIVSKSVEHRKAEQFARIMGKKLSKDVRVCKVEPAEIYNIKTGELLDKTEPVIALCAIGQPEQFFNFLKGYNVVSTKTFDDHYSYKKEDISSIRGKIVTTEKDAVKLLEFGFDNIYALKLKTSLDLKGLLK